MSSYGGQPNPNFPFGYNTDIIEGIGLPPYPTPGRPIGQPLLNENEQKNLSNFLTHFDDNNISSQQGGHFHTHNPHSIPPGASYAVPRYMGAETYVGSRRSIDPVQLQQVGDGSVLDLTAQSMQHFVPQPVFDSHMPQDFYPSTGFGNLYGDHLQPAANSHGPFSDSWQHSQLQNYMPVHGPGRLQARFGNDDRFGPNGFVGPGPHMEHDMSQLQSLNWIEAQTSATNTAPNSAHTTHPSSPVMSRKRTFDEYGGQNLSNGIHRFANGVHHNHSRSAPPLGVTNQHQGPRIDKQELKAPSPPGLSNLVSSDTPIAASHDAETDAEAESDNENKRGDTEPRTPASPLAPWPKNKALPPRKPPPPTKKRKPSASSKARASGNGKGSTPIRPKARPARSSTSTISHTPRQTLTADQKRANHTNSEQRRRDLTAQAYAELFDLVPDLEQMGKQSTMKRLEGVVVRVRELKEIVEVLRLQREKLLGVTTRDTADAGHSAKEVETGLREYEDHDHQRHDHDRWNWDDANAEEDANGEDAGVVATYPALG